MSLTIDLTPELETHLRDEAAKEGLAPNRYVVETLKARIDRNRDEQSIPHLSKIESELMKRINEGPPVETWREYHALIGRRNAGTMTDEEQKTLVGLVDQVEIAHARRLGYVLELGNLRGTTLDDMMDELGIVKPT